MKKILPKNRLIRLSILVFLGGSLSVFGDIYQWQDAKGREHYTDRNQENSKKLSIKPGYSYFTVDKVFDGDTVRLDDGRKVRLLGINTPEITHRNRISEAGGDVAKQWLSNKLQNKRVRLVTDVESFDKYHRTLAYLMTEHNELINLQLVELGLAAVTIYPPNLAYVNELVEAGKRAQQAKRGIWQHEAYSVVPVDLIDKKGHSGWIRLAGTVGLIRSSRKFVYLEFTDKFQARIEKKWLNLFPDVESYRGKTLEVRGWLNKNRGGWSMLIRHPSAIKAL